jgi:hypothetical protein
MGDDTEVPEPDPDLTPEERALVDCLSESQLAAIDAALLSHARDRPRKVAMLVGLAMTYGTPGRIEGVPDIFYAQRVVALVAAGKLDAFGNLAYMCFSEVSLPRGTGNGGT